MNLLVVPSIREGQFVEFLRAWEGKGGWDKVCLIEDGPRRTFSVQVDYHFSHAEITDLLGDRAWVISRGDSACRCFGFLVGHCLKAEHVLTLDDDVRPFALDGPPSFMERHVHALSTHPRWVSSVPGLRVRGLPYVNTGTLSGVMANVGLWMGHPDLDAVQSLNLLARHSEPAYGVVDGNWVVPHRQYVPVCGMNLCIRREALPLFYFPLQGEGQPYKRFDDIWAGVMAKRAFDRLGWHLSVGGPLVDHQKASDPFKNLVAEAPGVVANEAFWEVVDQAVLWSKQPLGAVVDLGRHFTKQADPYLRKLGEALKVWASLFDNPPPQMEKL